MTKSILSLALGCVVLLSCAARLSAQTVVPSTPEQVEKLVAVLKSDAAQKEKADACRLLAIVGTKEAVPALAELLDDEKLAHMARYGLETIPDPSVDDALRDALPRVKGRLQVGVIGSLGVRGDEKAVELLVPLLTAKDVQIACATARALGKIATPEATKALQDRLAAAPEPVRPAVADGCLACAEALLADGKRDAALAVYMNVAKADLPKHFRVAAMQGAILAQQKGQ